MSTIRTPESQRAATGEALNLFKALAEPTRLLSLLLIDAEGELCVCELMAALEQPQSKVSRHLAHLRETGLLRAERRGQWVFYRLAPLPDWARAILAQTREGNPALLAGPVRRLHASDRPNCC